MTVGRERDHIVPEGMRGLESVWGRGSSYRGPIGHETASSPPRGWAEGQEGQTLGGRDRRGGLRPQSSAQSLREAESKARGPQPERLRQGLKPGSQVQHCGPELKDPTRGKGKKLRRMKPQQGH